MSIFKKFDHSVIITTGHHKSWSTTTKDKTNKSGLENPYSIQFIISKRRRCSAQKTIFFFNRFASKNKERHNYGNFIGSLTRRLEFWQEVTIHHLIAFYDAKTLMTRSVINLSSNFKTKWCLYVFFWKIFTVLQYLFFAKISGIIK